MIKLKTIFLFFILILFVVFHCCIYTSICCFTTHSLIGNQPVYCIGGTVNSSCEHVWVRCDDKCFEPSTLNLYHYRYVPYKHPTQTYTTTKELIENVNLASPFYVDWKFIKTQLSFKDFSDWNHIKTNHCVVIQTFNKIPLTKYDTFLEFLEQDTTNNNTYILTGNDMYICVNFATQLSQNLNNNGYESGTVVRSAKWHNKGIGHLLTWVKIDNQLYVIESMNDYVWTSEAYNKSINKNIYVTRYESLDEGYKKVNEMYNRR